MLLPLLFGVGFEEFYPLGYLCDVAGEFVDKGSLLFLEDEVLFDQGVGFGQGGKQFLDGKGIFGQLGRGEQGHQLFKFIFSHPNLFLERALALVVDSDSNSIDDSPDFLNIFCVFGDILVALNIL